MPGALERCSHVAEVGAGVRRRAWRGACCAESCVLLACPRETNIELYLSSFTWRREWQSTPVLLPGESHGQRSLAGYSPWGRRESDMTERLLLLTTGNILQVLFHSWIGELRLFVGCQCERTAGILRLVSPGLCTFPCCRFYAVSFCIINYNW